MISHKTLATFILGAVITETLISYSGISLLYIQSVKMYVLRVVLSLLVVVTVNGNTLVTSNDDIQHLIDRMSDVVDYFDSIKSKLYFDPIVCMGMTSDQIKLTLNMTDHLSNDTNTRLRALTNKLDLLVDYGLRNIDESNDISYSK